MTTTADTDGQKANEPTGPALTRELHPGLVGVHDLEARCSGVHQQDSVLKAVQSPLQLLVRINQSLQQESQMRQKSCRGCEAFLHSR